MKKIGLFKIKESLLTGIKEIYYHILRSLLTMLGIVLGVASLITMTSIIESAKRKSIEQISVFGGLDRVSIKIVEKEKLLESGDIYKMTGLEIKDADALIKNHSDFIKNISLQRYHRGYLKHGNQSMRIWHIAAGTPSYFEINKYHVERGRKLSMIDDWSLSRVCVIGTIIEKELFEEYEEALNSKINIEGVDFRIVGILSNYQSGHAFQARTKNTNEKKEKEKKKLPLYAIRKQKGGKSRIKGWHLWRKYGKNNTLWYKNIVVILPYSTMEVLFKEDSYIDSIEIQLKDSINLDNYVERIRQTLEKLRGKQDFEIKTASERYEMVNKQIKTFNLVLGLIAGISLLVGGIGIMNVILASISERIREIGVRKSVGASNLDIFVQFLIETSILALIGGFLGVILSFVFTSLITKFAGLDAIVSLPAIIIALLFSNGVSVIFGIYPSLKAAKLNPIDALHYE